MNKKLKTAIFVVFDVLVYVIAWALAFVLTKQDLVAGFMGYWVYLLIGAVLMVMVNFFLKVYSMYLKYAGFVDALRIAGASFILGIYNLIAILLSGVKRFDWLIIFVTIQFIVTGISRFFKRFLKVLSVANSKGDSKTAKKRVMIVGAGHAGSMLIREMENSYKYNMKPVCVVDDNPDKLKSRIEGIKVVGKTDDIKEIVKEYDIEQIIIAMPSAKKKEISKIASICQETKCQTKILPGIYQFTNGQVSIADTKPISISDLLGREKVKVNLNEIMGYIEGKVVMVTGGGGSIGSELCRNIAQHNPKQLIILDIYENNAYDIEQELRRKLPNLNMLVLIASVRDRKKIETVFKRYSPQIVFHAAAHKHVPLMETSPNEAVKNNVGGTLNVAEMAGKYGAEKFILISTDKAVNPTNIMGATKRICEMIIQTLDKKYKTDFVAVRFGNVLGSNGSVIPLFKKQIEEGGPITVTHKNIVRYFMTIPEAVSLVLQAGAYAKGGEIFVLDMGEPVKIYDLAYNMIKLSGLEPFEDIDIKVTGLRQGEKLYEERLMAEEGLAKTENEKISIGKPLEINEKELFEKIDGLLKKAKEETLEMKELVHDLVPTYVIDRREM